MPSIFGLPPNSAFTFLLSIRAVPLVTTSTTRSPTRNESVFAIRAGSTPKASAASTTVAELCLDTITQMSGAFSAKKARTDSRLMEGYNFRQFRQGTNAMVHLDAQRIHLGAQRLEQCERRQRLAIDTGERHRLRRHPLDPGDVEPECLGAACVPRVGGDEQDVGGLNIEFLLDQRVG